MNEYAGISMVGVVGCRQEVLLCLPALAQKFRAYVPIYIPGIYIYIYMKREGDTRVHDICSINNIIVGRVLPVHLPNILLASLFFFFFFFDRRQVKPGTVLFRVRRRLVVTDTSTTKSIHRPHFLFFSPSGVKFFPSAAVAEVPGGGSSLSGNELCALHLQGL